MRGNELLDKMELVDPSYVESAENCGSPRRRTPLWLKYSIFAACLCLVALLPYLFSPGATTPMSPIESSSPAEPHEGAPSLVVDGVCYVISPHIPVTYTLPEGFSLGGEADIGGYESLRYYVNSDVPEWVYVYQEVRTIGQVDSSGTLISTEPHNAYLRYVHESLRGRDLVYYNGSYYISMWSVQCFGDDPDISWEHYDAMESRYGVQIEGPAPDGFNHVGKTVFSGHDSIPRENLSCNEGSFDVYASADEPDVIFVSSVWTNASGSHSGFDTYIRYDFPLA